MLFFSKDDEGQLGWVYNEKDLVVDTDYILMTGSSLIEKQNKQHYDFQSYCDEFGVESLESEITNPEKDLLSLEPINKRKYIGLFKRYKHHKEDPSIFIAEIKNVITDDSVSEVKVVVNSRHKQFNYPVKFTKFIETSVENLSSKHPKPYNLNLQTNDETLLFVRSGDSFMTTYEDRRLFIDNCKNQKGSAGIFFTRFSSTKPKSNITYYKAHGIPFDLITKDEFVKNMHIIKSRLTSHAFNHLIFIGLKSGDTIVGMSENSGNYYLVKTPTHYKKINISETDMKNHILTIKKVFTIHKEIHCETVTSR